MKAISNALKGVQYASPQGERLYELARRATSRHVDGVDEILFQQVVYMINSEMSSPPAARDAVVILKRRLQMDHPQKQYLAILLTSKVLQECHATVGSYQGELLQEVAYILRSAHASGPAAARTRQAAMDALRVFGAAGGDAYRQARQQHGPPAGLRADSVARDPAAVAAERQSLLDEIKRMCEQAGASTEILNELILNKSQSSGGAGADESAGLRKELLADVRELRKLFDAYMGQLAALQGPDAEAAMKAALEAVDQLDAALTLEKDVDAELKDLQEKGELPAATDSTPAEPAPAAAESSASASASAVASAAASSAAVSSKMASMNLIDLDDAPSATPPVAVTASADPFAPRPAAVAAAADPFAPAGAAAPPADPFGPPADPFAAAAAPGAAAAATPGAAAAAPADPFAALAAAPPPASQPPAAAPGFGGPASGGGAAGFGGPASGGGADPFAEAAPAWGAAAAPAAAVPQPVAAGFEAPGTPGSLGGVPPPPASTPLQPPHLQQQPQPQPQQQAQLLPAGMPGGGYGVPQAAAYGTPPPPGVAGGYAPPPVYGAAPGYAYGAPPPAPGGYGAAPGYGYGYPGQQQVPPQQMMQQQQYPGQQAQQMMQQPPALQQPQQAPLAYGGAPVSAPPPAPAAFGQDAGALSPSNPFAAAAAPAGGSSGGANPFQTATQVDQEWNSFFQASKTAGPQ